MIESLGKTVQPWPETQEIIAGAPAARGTLLQESIPPTIPYRQCVIARRPAPRKHPLPPLSDRVPYEARVRDWLISRIGNELEEVARRFRLRDCRIEASMNIESSGIMSLQLECPSANNAALSQELRRIAASLTRVRRDLVPKQRVQLEIGIIL